MVPELLPPPQEAHSIARSTVRATAGAKRYLRRTHSANTPAANPASQRSVPPIGGHRSKVGLKNIADGAVVITVTLTCTGVVPSAGVTGVGDRAQFVRVSVGGFVHVNDTCWLKPPAGVTVSV